MSDEPKKNGPQEPDEIDKFLATLPSLHIPDDMIADDIDLTSLRTKPRKQVTVTGVFILIAWFVLLFSLMTIARAAPSRGTAWYTILGERHFSYWNHHYLLSAMYYLFGNCVVCAGGLCICLIKKIKMTSGTSLNFWIAGGLSAVTAVVVLILR
jgi:hypothetical protein